MSVLYGKNTEQWYLDEQLRLRASELIARFPDELGHIDVDRVIFGRLQGYKIPKSGKAWYGKCWHLKPPVPLIAHYSIMRIAQARMIETRQTDYLEHELQGLAYIIIVNTDAIHYTSNADPALTAQLEEITLHHELLHIKPDMEGVVPHPVQDFAEILDRYGVHWDQGVITQPESLGNSVQVLQDFTAKLSAQERPSPMEESD